MAIKLPNLNPKVTNADPSPGEGPRIFHISPNRSSIHLRHSSHGPFKYFFAFLRDSAQPTKTSIAESLLTCSATYENSSTFPSGAKTAKSSKFKSVSGYFSR
ncbi:hypothetical protein DSECCO2_639110 [anaerobic digester metagenome]